MRTGKAINRGGPRERRGAYCGGCIEAVSSQPSAFSPRNHASELHSRCLGQKRQLTAEDAKDAKELVYSFMEESSMRRTFRSTNRPNQFLLTFSAFSHKTFFTTKYLSIRTETAINRRETRRSQRGICYLVYGEWRPPKEFKSKSDAASGLNARADC